MSGPAKFDAFRTLVQLRIRPGRENVFMIQKTSEALPSHGNLDDDVPAARAARFAERTRQWKEQKQFMSSVSQMAMLPTYQRIIGMGPSALPLIFKELDQQPDHWFWALASITGEDPVPQEHRGKIGIMRQAWLDWARASGYFN